MQIFDLHLSKKYKTNKMQIKKRKMKVLTNLYISGMTGLRNLSKQEKEKTIYIINFKWRKKRTYSESSQTSKIVLFVKIVNGWKPLFNLAKSSILDLWLDSEYASEQYHLSVHIVCFIGQVSYNKLKFKSTLNLSWVLQTISQPTQRRRKNALILVSKAS